MSFSVPLKIYCTLLFASYRVVVIANLLRFECFVNHENSTRIDVNMKPAIFYSPRFGIANSVFQPASLKPCLKPSDSSLYSYNLPGCKIKS